MSKLLLVYSVTLTVVFFLATANMVQVASYVNNGDVSGEKVRRGMATQGTVWTGRRQRRSPHDFRADDWVDDNAGPWVSSNCTKWVVITTIFPPTTLVRQLEGAEGKEWCLVVVGDERSPRDYPVGDRVHYLGPADQRALGWAIMDHIPWNHFGRKNVGYLYAVAHGAEVIYDTDDDNILKMPLETVSRFLRPTQAAFLLEEGGPPVTNVYPLFTSNLSWPRGFPLGHINDPASVGRVAGVGDLRDVGIIQSLADHDPDVDAVYRLTRPLPLVFDQVADLDSLVLPRGTFSPFNAQATLFQPKALWALLLPVTVHGRVSDIWRSYYMQKILWGTGQAVAFTTPWVKQCRNVHSYMADFDAEGDLYEKAEGMVSVLAKWKPRASTVPGRMVEAAVEMYERGFLEEGDVKLMRAWVADLRRVGYIFPSVTADPVVRPVQTYKSGGAVDPQCDRGVALGDECLPSIVNTSFYSQRNLLRGARVEDLNLTGRRFIFLDSHKAPQLDSLSSVALDLGVPPENMGTVCALNYCHLNEDVRRRYAKLTHKNKKEAEVFIKNTYESGAPVLPGAAFDDFVRSFDVVVCTFPTWHCDRYLDSGGAVVILRFSHSPWHRMKGNRRVQWIRRLARLADNPKVIITSNNPYHYTMFKTVTGRFPVPWPAAYAHVRGPRGDRTWRPTVDRWVAEVGAEKIYSRGAVDLFHKLGAMGDVNYTSFHNMVEPVDRRAEISLAVVFPYAAHTGKITELYAAGVPLLLPSVDLAVRLQHKKARFMWHRDAVPDGWDRQYCAAPLVLNKKVPTEAATESLRTWYKYTEYYQWPHVFYYDSMEPAALHRKIKTLLADEEALRVASRGALAFFDKVRAETRTELKLHLKRAFEKVGSP
jgi:hypothetical protein